MSPRQRLLRRASISTLLLLAMPCAHAQGGGGAAALEPATSLNRATVEQRGWAAETRGGRGGRIIVVSNLDAAGPGSLRAAIEASGPRTVVFEVGGVIDMAGAQLAIRQPFITIAGQTAPHPGITVIKAETTIATHDVIVQHLMFRPGEFGPPRPACV